MNIVAVWGICAGLILASHVFPAALIDGRVAFGTWTRIALALFVLLGPLGVLAELLLLFLVGQDLLAQRCGEAGRSHQ